MTSNGFPAQVAGSHPLKENSDMSYLPKICRSPGCVANPAPGSRHCDQHGIVKYAGQQRR